MIMALFALVFFSACQDSGVLENEVAPANETTISTQRTQSVVLYDLHISLEDHYGNAVAISSTGLGGFAAKNLETNQYYYQERSQTGEISAFIEGLPEGTYRVDAYDGYFDGASSAVVTVSSENEDEEGFIPVTLGYWSE